MYPPDGERDCRRLADNKSVVRDDRGSTAQLDGRLSDYMMRRSGVACGTIFVGRQCKVAMIKFEQLSRAQFSCRAQFFKELIRHQLTARAVDNDVDDGGRCRPLSE